MTTHPKSNLASADSDTPSEPHIDSAKRSQRGAESFYLAIALLPPALLAIVFAVAIVDEARDESWLKQQFDSAGPMGRPLTQTSGKDWFEEITSRTDTRPWHQVLEATNRLDHGLDPYVKNMNKLVPADGDWSAMPYAKQASDRVEPVAKQIVELKSSEMPVWMPVHFDGVMTWLTPIQESRGLVLMLKQRFKVEFHSGESRNAIDALEGIGAVAEAFDWPLFAVTELVRISHLSDQWDLVRESLQYDQWTAEDLKRLREILGPQENADQTWSGIVRGARAELMTEFSSSEAGSRYPRYQYGLAQLNPFGMSASHLRPYLSYLDGLASVAGAGTWNHVRQAGEVQDDYFGREWHRGRLRRTRNLSLVAIPFADGNQLLDYYIPSIDSMAEAMATRELRRRWTLTAIGIKQFQLQEDRFPKTLWELTKVGLTPEDWEFDVNKPFGYRIAPAGKWDFDEGVFVRDTENPSGQQAELWTPDIIQASSTDATSGPFPDPKNSGTAGASKRVTTIR